MIAAITICYVVVTVVTGWLLVHGRRGFVLNPAVLFLISQAIMFMGTVPMIEAGSDADHKYLLILFIAMIFTCFGIGYACFLQPVPKEENLRWFDSPLTGIETGPRLELVVYSIIIGSIVIAFLYYNAVGYNLFIVALGNLLTGGANQANDIGTMRLEFYADPDNYFAPGYVNQFKNLLLPCLLAFVAARRCYSRSRLDLITLIIAVPLCLAFLLGTGQRFPIVMACGCAGVYLFYSVPKRLSKRILVTLSLFAIIFFLAGTLILGRGGESESGGSLSVLASDAASRFTGGNQDTGLVGFRFIQRRPITWGMDYYYRIARIIRILPGGKRDLMMIDNEVYAFQYGTPRGTAPMHIWGESWYNFGWLGVTVMPFGLGFLYQRVFTRMIRGPKTLGRLLVYVYGSVLLGTWATAGPDYLLNNGLITVLILSFLLRHFALQPTRGSAGLVTLAPAGPATS